VTEVVEVVSRLERTGGRLTLDGDRIRYSVPSGNPEVSSLLAQLRRRREELTELLRQRAAEESERCFARPHAKLFPFLGRKVRTPAGPGTLLQVFANRATVLLDSELSRCSLFAPGEIKPLHSE
jgi:hypothetical protein